VWGNSNGQIVKSDGSQPIVSYSDVEGGLQGQGNIDADPMFLDPANHDYHITPESPCVDAGDPDFVPGEGETDID